MGDSQDGHPTVFSVAFRLELRALYILGKSGSTDQHIRLALHFPWTMLYFLFLTGNELLISFISLPAQLAQMIADPDVPIYAPTFSIKATDQNIISV